MTAGGRGSPRRVRREGKRGASERKRERQRVGKTGSEYGVLRSGGENGCAEERRGDPSAGARVSHPRDGEQRATARRPERDRPRDAGGREGRGEGCIADGGM